MSETHESRGASGRLQWPTVAAGALGLLWFIYTSGAHTLDPTYLGWITGDHAQHLLGWLFFRNEPWQFPLGVIPGLMHPLGTTLGYTDANPWVAILLKPFTSSLPVAFQFIGPWLGMCFVLQGVFAAKIMERLTANPWHRVLGACLFIVTPPLLNRVGHDTLAAHWLLLGMIWLHSRPTTLARNSVIWAIVFNFIAAGVHPYLATMLLPLTAALLVRLVIARRLSGRAALGLGAATAVQSGVIFVLLGYVGSPTELGGAGFGFYSADILAFFNSMTYSRWTPPLPGSPGQYEGFAFLGTGVLALATIYLVLATVRRQSLRIAPDMWPLVVAATALGIFALSDVITIAGNTIVTMRGFYSHFRPIVDPLRASGRFIWPLHYVVLMAIVALAVRPRLARPAAASVLLVAAIATQAAEVHPGTEFPRGEWVRMESPVWNSLGRNYKHMVVYPPYYAFAAETCEAPVFTYEEVIQLSDLAYRKGLTINSAYVARTSMPALRMYCEELRLDAATGRFAHDTVYVVGRYAINLFRERDLVCGILDGYHICVSDAVKTPFRQRLEAESERPMRGRSRS